MVRPVGYAIVVGQESGRAIERNAAKGTVYYHSDTRTGVTDIR
jgi:hypothetical protein